MGRILRKRVPFYLLTAWMAVTLNFAVPRLMPGNPAQLLLSRLVRQGNPSPFQLKAIEAEFGIKTHGNLFHQYLAYLWNVLHFRLGVSLTFFPESVSTVIATALPWTIALVTLGTIISYAIGIVTGIVLAWRRGSRLDSTVVPMTTFFSAVPFFLAALFLLWVLGVVAGVLPINGAYGSATTVGFNIGFFVSWADHAILPVFAIVASSFAGHLLHMRNMMVTTLGDDYVLMAEAKGLSQRRIKYVYAARNAVLPSVASFTLALGFVVGGSILIETVFSYPGIGDVLYQAVNNEDYPLMQGCFLVIALAVLVANLIADLVYAALDPRARAQQAR